MIKKLYLVFSLVIVCLLFVYGLNEKPTEDFKEFESVDISLVEETNKVEVANSVNVIEGIVLSIDNQNVLVYNYSTEQVEEYNIQDFYYQESLFYPSKGALVKYQHNLWNVYWTREAQDFYCKGEKE